MRKIKGSLILKEDTEFLESIEVEGDIKGYFDLKVRGDIDAGNINAGNINAWDIDAGNINAKDINARDINAKDINACDIDAWNINARNINAWDIDAGNINAWDINAGNINAWDIICERRFKKTKNSKTICRIYIKEKSKIKKEEKKE